MEDILTIDNGNTNPHVGVFSGFALKEVVPFDKFSRENDIRMWPVILSNVGKEIPELRDHPNLKRVSDYRQGKMFLDMTTNYSQSLGEDRLVSCYYVYRKEIQNKGHSRVLLLDAGTFITLDVIGSFGHEGGFIMPGLGTFLNSYSKGVQLPDLSLSKLESGELKLGHTTTDAILEGTRLYANAITNQMNRSYPTDAIVITGGHGELFKDILCQELPPERASFDPHLIHQALHRVYQITNS